MTAATAPTTNLRPDVQAAGPAIPMTRLVEVELRKMIDTRAGRWLLISVAGLVALVLAVVVATTNQPDDRSFSTLAQIAQFPVSVLLPILGVLAATSEWNQRTVLGTFSLVPRRGRSLQAKVLAALVLATVAYVVAMLFAAIASGLAGLFTTVDQDWSLGWSNAGETLVYQWLSMLLGVALGTVFLSSGLAIVLYFALPMIWGGIVDSFKSLADVQLWADVNTSWARLVMEDPMNGEWWARVGTTTLVWVVLPLGLGAWRVLRKEVD
ncbi:MAG: hypothetical protein J7513_14110 [Solirubrobacteraceae bacterium]|nr:hypothetical protein [Solirubrobacteraceae bacterium]